MIDRRRRPPANAERCGCPLALALGLMRRKPDNDMAQSLKDPIVEGSAQGICPSQGMKLEWDHFPKQNSST